MLGMTTRSIYSVNASYQLICAPMERGMCKISSPFRPSLNPTPADRLKGRMLQSSGRPCLSPSIRLRTSSASWSALPRLTSVPSNEAYLGGRSYNRLQA